MNGAQGRGAHGRFVWYELATTDIAAAQAFYTAVVGWDARDASVPGGAYILFTIGGAAVSGLMELPEDARRSGFRPGWLGYVAVDDVDASAARVEQLGGAVHVPPRDIPDISRLSVAVDPQAATIGMLKWRDPGQAQTIDLDAPGGIGWHELFAADWEKAWSFYGGLFGWRKETADVGAQGTYQLFSAGGLTLGGMFTKPPTVPHPFWLYYFNVADIDVAMKRVKDGGGQVLNGPIEVPGDRWIAQCTDPQGAIFALTGKRSHNGIGYFARTSRDRDDDARAGAGKRSER